VEYHPSNFQPSAKNQVILGQRSEQRPETKNMAGTMMKNALKIKNRTSSICRHGEHPPEFFFAKG
jgi:hypothetical protein